MTETRRMRYGLNLANGGPYADPRTMADLAALAEESGWDGVFLEDYLVYQNQTGTPTYDPWVTLAAMAMRTQRIRLGTTVTPLPRRRIAKLAAEAVALDHLSGGRLTLGLGLGDAWDVALANLGEQTDTRTRAAMLDEGLEVLVGLWSGAGAFDMAAGGRARKADWDAERALIEAVAEAGATWWMEWIAPTDISTAKAAIADGPLRTRKSVQPMQ